MLCQWIQNIILVDLFFIDAHRLTREYCLVFDEKSTVLRVIIKVTEN